MFRVSEVTRLSKAGSLLALLLLPFNSYADAARFTVSAKVVTFNKLGMLMASRLRHEKCSAVVYNPSENDVQVTLKDSDYFPKSFRLKANDYQYVRCRSDDPTASVFMAGEYVGAI